MLRVKYKSLLNGILPGPFSSKEYFLNAGKSRGGGVTVFHSVIL